MEEISLSPRLSSSPLPYLSLCSELRQGGEEISTVHMLYCEPLMCFLIKLQQ